MIMNLVEFFIEWKIFVSLEFVYEVCVRDF